MLDDDVGPGGRVEIEVDRRVVGAVVLEGVETQLAEVRPHRVDAAECVGEVSAAVAGDRHEVDCFSGGNLHAVLDVLPE